MASLHDSPAASIPHFFRIILDKTSKNTRIKIPVKFLMRYGDNLSSPVHLKLPSGAKMEIELRRCNDGGVWFDKGWPEFSKFCSLDYGNWLVFGYEGNSNFHVFIFDRTATEIEYPKPKMEETDSDSEQEEDDDDDDDDDDESGHARGEIKSHGRGAIDRVEKRRNPIIKVETDCTTNYENGKYKRLKTGGQVNQRPLNSSSRALEAANRFTPKNPSFRATLGSTPLILHVPVTFARSFVKKRKQTVTLQVRGRSWPVNLIGHTKESGAKLCGGWREFVTENCLMEGDVCIFELIERNDIVLKVHIFRC